MSTEKIIKGNDLEIGSSTNKSLSPLYETVLKLDEKSYLKQTKPIPKKDFFGGGSSLLVLFSWGTPFDYLLLSLGIICGALTGLGLPLLNYILGNILTAFIGLVSISRNSGTSLVSNDINSGEFWSEITHSLIQLFTLGCGLFVTSYIMMASLGYTSIRQSYRLRMALFSALLKKPVSFFDGFSSNGDPALSGNGQDNSSTSHNIEATTNIGTSGELASRATADLALVQDGLSSKLGLIVLHLTCFIAGFAISFYRCWQLTLVMCVILPIIGGSSFIFLNYVNRLSLESQARYARANSLAGEILAGIRTIISFNAQEKEKATFIKVAHEAGKKNEGSFIVTGVSIGAFWCIIFCSYALAFYVGALMIEADIILERGVLTGVFFSIIMGSMSIGHIFPNIAAIAKGAAAASTLSSLIKNTSPIETSHMEPKAYYSNKEDLRGLITSGGISFENVSFR